MSTPPRAALSPILVVTVLSVGSPALAAGDYFVKPAGTGVACTQSAPCALPAALALAQDGERVWVGAGTYTGTGTDAVLVARGVELLGGWSGAASGPPARDPVAYPTVIDGQGARRGVRIDGDGATLDGFAVTGGNATGLVDGCASNADGCGGGIFVTGDRVRIVNSRVHGNVASTTPSSGAQVIAHGGGIMAFRADDLVIEDSTISDNVAHTGNSGEGGGVEVNACERAAVARNRITGNTATTYPLDNGWGGGIAVHSYGAVIADNVFSGNRAHASRSSDGNAIYTWYASGAMRGNAIASDNRGQAVVLGFFAGQFTDNRVTTGEDEEALWVYNSETPQPLEVTNNVFAGGAGTVGVVLIRGYAGGPVTALMRHNTIVGPGHGAGVHVYGAATVTMINNIIASVDQPLKSSLGGVIGIEYTLFWDVPENTPLGLGKVVGDPIFANRAAGDFHILPGSAAIGAGVDAGIGFDVDGEARPGAGGLDVGADELAPRRFDFGTPTSPVEPGYEQVTPATAYTPTRGFGWTDGTIAARDRGTGDNLRRDFCFAPLAIFGVAVPNGRYRVTLTMGDAAAGHGQMAVFLEGAKVAAVSTAGNEFKTQTFETTVGDGLLAVLLDDEGGADPNAVINALTVEPALPLRLDLGTASSPVAPGWARATHASAYTQSAGSGWAGGALQSRDRGTADPLLRDLVFSPRALFAAGIPNGLYDVMVTLGDAAAAHDRMGVAAQGGALTEVTTAKNQFASRSARANVADGLLALRLADQGGTDANVAVNAIEITPPPLPLFDFGTATSPVEPGYVRVSERTLYAEGRGYGWTAGSVASRDRGTGSALARDLVFSKDATFAVDLRPGRYEVTVTVGDAAAGHDQVTIEVGDTQGDTLSFPAGQFSTRAFQVVVVESPLLFRIVDSGGADPNAVINGLAIR